MGSFDMCQSPKVYSFDAVKTHYCALGTDVSTLITHSYSQDSRMPLFST